MLLENENQNYVSHRGITINVLAVKSKIPSSNLMNIAYGHVENTGVETTAKLYESLGITIREFFTGEDFT